MLRRGVAQAEDASRRCCSGRRCFVEVWLWQEMIFGGDALADYFVDVLFWQGMLLGGVALVRDASCRCCSGRGCIVEVFNWQGMLCVGVDKRV